MEYQSINERLRKDKTTLDENVAELNKKIEMMEMLQKSAAMVMGRNDFDDDNNGGNSMNTGGGLGGELRDFEDMDGSFNAGDNNNSNNQINMSDIRDSRRGTLNIADLNQSINSDFNNDSRKNSILLPESTLVELN